MKHEEIYNLAPYSEAHNKRVWAEGYLAACASQETIDEMPVTPMDRYDVILWAAQKAVGKQLEPGRSHDDVMIRYIVCRQMVTEGFPTNMIGRLIGRDHSTVLYGSNYIKTALEMPLVYWDVVSSWNRFQDIMNEFDRNETE